MSSKWVLVEDLTNFLKKSHGYRRKRLKRLASQILCLVASPRYPEVGILVCWPSLGTEAYFCQIESANSLEAAVWFWNTATDTLLGLLWVTVSVLTRLLFRC